MATQWGRKETVIWPPQVPIYTYGVLLLMVPIALTLLFSLYLTKPFLARNYTGAYIKATLGSEFNRLDSYRLIYLGRGKRAPRLALPEDFIPGSTVVPGGKEIRTALSPAAIAQGFTSFFRGPERKFADASIQRWLQSAIFGGDGLLASYAPALIETACVVIFLLCFAVPWDFKRGKRLKYGRLLRGPEMLPPAEFNRALKGDGMGIRTNEKGTIIRLPVRSEAKHIEVMGDTGVGKTSVLSSVREGAERSGYAVEGFAPTSRAAGQLREAGISATTLQSFLVRSGEEQGTGNPASRHLYMLDESSLSSTRQMRSFLDKIGPNDRVLVIGDIRQHQGVDAGRPFEQMQDAGMHTSRLDQIMRQQDPELLKAVQHLAKGETIEGIRLLGEQGRITEIPKALDRIEAIAKDYAARPDNTIIVSPDNRSRQLINQSVRIELQATGALAKDDQEFRTLVHRSDMTGADREWAARYQPGDVLRYTNGSKANEIERDSVATVVSTNARNNTVTIEREDGQSVTYDPRRLRGVNVYREVPREFAIGERIQFTARDKDLGVNNRDLGIITKIESANITVLMDGKDQRTVSFDPTKMRHFDHGYAVTSHSSQGLTEGRVIANIDTDSSRSLINSRLAYVAISRASEDARIYTNNAETLGARLAAEVTKSAAVDFRQVASRHQHDAPRPTINQYADPSHRLAAVASAYAEKPDSTIVVAPDRGERRELNQLIRADLEAQGRLAPDSRSFTIRIEQTLDNPKLAAEYTPGDRIQFRQGSQSDGIANNSTVQVLAVDPKSNQLTVQTSTGDEITYSPHLTRAMTAHSTVYRIEQREIAVGERIQLREGNSAQGIRKGDLGTVTALSTSNGLEFRLDRGSTVRVNEEQTQHIEHGYAVQNLKAGAPERILVSQEVVTIHLDLFLHSRNAREVSVYTSDGSGLGQAPIASRETLQHQQMESASNVVAPDPMHVEHRRSIGR